MSKKELLSQLQNLVTQYNEISARLVSDHQELRDEPISSVHNIVECETTTRALKKENEQCKKEIRFLKDLLKRCNQQLNKRIQTSHDSSGLIQDEVAGLVYDNKNMDISRESVFKLHVLLKAYDEVINEQELGLKRFSSSHEESLQKIRILKEENSKFQDFFSIFRAEAPLSSDFQVAQDVKLLLEERECLLEEVDLLLAKEKQVEKDFKEEAQSLKTKLQQESDSVKKLEEKFKKSQSGFDQLQEKLKFLNNELKNSIGQDDHAKSIAECSKKFEELRSLYGGKSSTLEASVVKEKKEKESLKERLHTSTEKMQGMKKAVYRCTMHIRKKHTELSRQRDLITALRTSRKDLYFKLKKLSRVCHKLLADRKELLQEMEVLKKEYAKCSHLLTSKSQHLGKISIKLKEERLGLLQRVAEAEGKRHATEEAWTKSMKDMARMRELLKSKEEVLQAAFKGVGSGILRQF